MLQWLRDIITPSPPPPPFVQDYLRVLQQQPLPGSLPLAEIPFVVFDTETTGLDPQKDRLLSIGAVKVQHWEIDISRQLELYVGQEAPSPASEQAIAVHGILPGEQSGQISEEEALRQFLAYAGPSVLVAHHLGFDQAMINQLLRQHGGGSLRNKGVDTAVLARRLSTQPELAQRGDFGLDALCRQYNITMSDRHTAAGDAYITGILLMKLLYRLQKRGVHTLGQLLKSPKRGL